MVNTTRITQPTLFDPPPPQVEPLKTPDPILATWSAICPLCSKFIAKNHSKIARLPHPIQPRSTPDRRRSLDDRGFYYASGNPIYTGEKHYSHERCWPRHLKAPRYEAIYLFRDPDRSPVYRLIDRRDETLHYLYRLFSQDGRLLYVGITHDLEQRLGQHYTTRPWEQVRDVYRLTVQEYPTRSDVLEAEHQAIATENPLWNIAR